ncbi:MAG: hypothetical protein OXR73_12910 [Myxococcales bacterium]|nr:hypothetical protein [Myxococcales bacterium]
MYCWHPSLQQCDTCLKRDPAAASPPVPWEGSHGSPISRYLATLRGAFCPARTAPSFARTEVAPALRFLLLSALPLSLVAGIVPHTRLLSFEGAMKVRVLGQPGFGELVLDVLRAMASQVVLDAVQLLACALPFASLVRAYAGPEKVPFAVRMLFYRAWLHPCAALGVYLLVALAPGVSATAAEGPPDAVLWAAAAFQVGAPVLFMMAMAYVSRLACGLGMGWSILIVSVAVTVAAFAAWGAGQVLVLALPAVPNAPSS